MNLFSRWNKTLTQTLVGLGATVVTLLSSFGGARDIAQAAPRRAPATQPQQQRVIQNIPQKNYASAKDLMIQNAPATRQFIQQNQQPLIKTVEAGKAYFGLNRQGAYFGTSSPESVTLPDGRVIPLAQSTGSNMNLRSVPTETVPVNTCKTEDGMKFGTNPERSISETGFAINIINTNPDLCKGERATGYYPKLSETEVLGNGIDNAVERYRLKRDLLLKGVTLSPNNSPQELEVRQSLSTGSGAVTEQKTSQPHVDAHTAAKQRLEQKLAEIVQSKRAAGAQTAPPAPETQQQNPASSTEASHQTSDAPNTVQQMQMAEWTLMDAYNAR